MISAIITDECSHWIARISQLDGEPGDVGFDDFGGDDCDDADVDCVDVADMVKTENNLRIQGTDHRQRRWCK